MVKNNDIEVGEIIVTSINKEGTWSGFDFDLMNYISQLMKMPVIANGGCGSKDHLIEIFKNTKVSGAGVGSMFLYQKKNMGVLVSYLDKNEIAEIFK